MNISVVDIDFCFVNIFVRMFKIICLSLGIYNTNINIL